MNLDLRLPQDAFRKTPSRRDGISANDEEKLRAFGADLIQRAAILLRLPQVTSVGAAAIFQRFYFQRSFADVDARAASAACLHLACKVEETHRPLRDVVTIFFRLRMRASPSGSQDARSGRAFAGGPTPGLTDAGELQELKQEVIRMERLVLRELGFVVSLLLDHPHKYVLQLVKSVVRTPDWLVAELAQSAWSYLNDATRTVVNCMYQPHQVATAAIYLAARARNVKLPKEPPWWELFDTDLADMLCIARTILRLYSRTSPTSGALPLVRLRSARIPFVPAPTPLVDTPGPLRSPSDDERMPPPTPEAIPRREASEASLDLGRIQEMICEDQVAERISQPTPSPSPPSGGAIGQEAGDPVGLFACHTFVRQSKAMPPPTFAPPCAPSTHAPLHDGLCLPMPAKRSHSRSRSPRRALSHPIMIE
eukprot:TRINITY_DN7641_c0_g2_i1.p1 TRINITY_DN7641_c0_g2~~TRINITY_DN7641_c0_g2_i1.p1  ORF type:complete len:424 (+),score=51.23 TRINITY_DN7641_c0_g2_i1:128-1399(+)